LIPGRDDEPELEAGRGGKIFGTRNGAAVLGPKLHREELPSAI